MNEVNYLVIGGGISGLAFGAFCEDDDFLIIEKESEAGGYCRTIYKDGFIWDYAGHFFHFATTTLKEFFEGSIDRDDLIHKNKVTKIFYKNSLIDFPFQANIHQLNKDEYIDCLYDLYFREEGQDRNFQEMLYSKFGIAITEKFLKPYNEKLYACKLTDLDVNAMGRFFPNVNLDQVMRSAKNEKVDSYNSTFLYPKKGAQTFVKALLDSFDDSKVSLNEKVISVSHMEKVVTTNKRKIKYNYLINTAPLDWFISNLSNVDFGNAIQDFSFNRVLVLNLGFDKKSSFNDTHWVYFPHADVNFYRVGFYDNILDSDKLSVYVEIGFDSNCEIDVNKELDDTLAGLRKVGIISDHHLVSWQPVIMSPAYVHLSERIEVRKQEIFQFLEENDIFSIGRYGQWKYCSIEDSMMDAINLCEKFKV